MAHRWSVARSGPPWGRRRVVPLGQAAHAVRRRAGAAPLVGAACPSARPASTPRPPGAAALTVLVIAADPATAVQVAAALPAWTVLQAATGLSGLTVLRQHLRVAQPIQAVLLELELPDLSGPDTGVQLRQAAPTLPILPYTPQAHDLMLARYWMELGCGPPLAKPAAPAALAQALTAALQQVPMPTWSAALVRLQQKVAETEQQLRQAAGPLRVAVACSQTLDLLSVPALLTTAGVPVLLIGPPAQLEVVTLRGLHLTALVTTPPDGRAALGLARGGGCPLLVVAPTVAAGQTWLQTAAALGVGGVPLGVVVAQAGAEVTAALTALAAGAAYQDPLLVVAPRVLAVPHEATATRPALSARAWQLLALEAHGLAPAAIADQLGIQRATVYQMRSRLCRALELPDSYALRQWARAQLGLPD